MTVVMMKVVVMVMTVGGMVLVGIKWAVKVW